MRVSIDDLIRRDTITEMILKLSIFRYCKPYALIYLEGSIQGMFIGTSRFPICIFNGWHRLSGARKKLLNDGVLL
jgi:hypothetical protein